MFSVRKALHAVLGHKGVHMMDLSFQLNGGILSPVPYHRMGWAGSTAAEELVRELIQNTTIFFPKKIGARQPSQSLYNRAQNAPETPFTTVSEPHTRLDPARQPLCDHLIGPLLRQQT